MGTIISSIGGQYRRYRKLADDAFGQLDDGQLSTGPSGGLSVASVAWHISGNLASRFTDFLTTDGEKSWRKAGLRVRGARRDESRAAREVGDRMEGARCRARGAQRRRSVAGRDDSRAGARASSTRSIAPWPTLATTSVRSCMSPSCCADRNGGRSASPPVSRSPTTRIRRGRSPPPSRASSRWRVATDGRLALPGVLRAHRCLIGWKRRRFAPHRVTRRGACRRRRSGPPRLGQPGRQCCQEPTSDETTTLCSSCRLNHSRR